MVTSRASIEEYHLVPAGRDLQRHPKVQHMALPTHTSLPGTLITTRVLQALKLTAVPAGWLIDAPGALTQAQIDLAEQRAQAAGLSVETRPTGADVAQTGRLRHGHRHRGGPRRARAMTVGLIRSRRPGTCGPWPLPAARRGTRRALSPPRPPRRWPCSARCSAWPVPTWRCSPVSPRSALAEPGAGAEPRRDPGRPAARRVRRWLAAGREGTAGPGAAAPGVNEWWTSGAQGPRRSLRPCGGLPDQL